MMAVQSDECGRRFGDQMLRHAAEDFATVGVLVGSIAVLEDEMLAFREHIERERAARDAAHARQRNLLAAALLKKRVAVEELAAQRALELDAARRTMRRMAEEALRERAAEKAEGAARAHALAAVVGELEAELSAQRATFEEETRAHGRQLRGVSDQLGRADEDRARLVDEAEMAVRTLRADIIALVDEHQAEKFFLRLEGDKALALRDAAHAREVQELRAEHVAALRQQESALRAEMAWQAQAAEAERETHVKEAEVLRARLGEDAAAHAREVAELTSTLGEQTAVLATVRADLEWRRDEGERMSEERRRDARLRTSIERERRIYRLETGLESTPAVLRAPSESPG